MRHEPGVALSSWSTLHFHPVRRAAKTSGKVSYAVLSFGGFLGIGDDHYPLPWQSLKYDTNLGGYVTGITESRLQGAPKYRDEASWNWNDPAAGRSVNDYYGVPI
ncbi:PRC-barrel domain-containing protein [Bradyrhizobium elkanii]